jgi:hypothetical protein
VPPALIESSQEEREQVGDSNQHPLAQEKVIALHRASAEGADRPARRAREGQEATQLSLFGAVGSAEATPAEPTVAAGAAVGPQPGAAGGEVRSTGEASSYIAGIVLDFSRELGDEAHVAANITQALRLYGASGQGEQAFVGLLYEARRRTRQYQGRQGLGTIDNKMAYFFRVVASLIEV